MDINQESVELVPKYQSVVSELEKTRQENEYLNVFYSNGDKILCSFFIKTKTIL